MDIRAAVAHKPGAPLSVETVQLDGPRAGEVLVEIKATGICHTDAYTLSGLDPEGLLPLAARRAGATCPRSSTGIWKARSTSMI